MQLELKYCAAWNYEPKAVSLTSQLLTTYKQEISDLKLVPSSGGCFELSVNGQLIYSKLETGQFPDEQWVVDTIGQRVRAVRA